MAEYKIYDENGHPIAEGRLSPYAPLLFLILVIVSLFALCGCHG